MESSCILELAPPGLHTDVCIRCAFGDAGSVPAVVRLAHAPSPTARFEALGEIRLQPRSLRQLRHLFRLGQQLRVQRVLRVTCVGWLAEAHGGGAPHRGRGAAGWSGGGGTV